MRFYKYHNIFLPSVTTILSKTRDKKSEDALRKWRHSFNKKNGEDAATNYVDKARENGVNLHTIIYEYLLGKKPNEQENLYFEQIKGFLDLIRYDIYELEYKIFTKKYAGQLDCVAIYESELQVIDWKTAIKPKRKQWIEEYFLQATAYSLGYTEATGREINSFSIVIATKDTLQIFTEKVEDWRQKWEDKIEIFYSDENNFKVENMEVI